MKKLIFGMIICVMMALILPMAVSAVDFDGGNGSPSNPWQISTAEQLNEVRSNLTAHYKLMNDIDLSTSTYNSTYDGGNGWMPIGNNSTNDDAFRFTGTFDGNGKKIENIYINRNASKFQGLFGYIGSSGVVKNLGIASGSVTVTNENNAGGVAGYNGGTITNCYNTATIAGIDNVGGVVGYNGGSITNSYNSGEINGGTNVSGVAGGSSGTITNSYNDGNVTGIGNNVGGIVGAIWSGSIENCHSTATIAGIDNVGGVVGSNSGNITNSYNSGTVNGSTNVGGVVGAIWSGSIENCYNSDSGNVNGTANNIGGVVGNNQGSIINSYNIGTVSGAGNTVGGVVGGNSGNITNSYNTNNVTSTGNNVGGVVGSIWSGSIEKCYNIGSVIGTGTHSDNVGGVAGSNNGSIGNCYNRGNVDGKTNIGGVVGWSNGTIVNCYNSVGVTGTNARGGLAGYNGGTITNCYWNNSTITIGMGSGTPIIGGGGMTTENMMKQDIFDNDDDVDDWDFDTIWAIDPAKNGGYPYLIQLYTITFDANDGTVTPSSAITDVDGKLANLPADPTRDGYTFDGWYTDATGGTKVTIDTEFTKNTTVYAHWTKKTTPKPDEPIEPDEPEVVPEVIPEPEPEVKPDPDPTPVPKPETPPITIIVPNNTTTIIIDNGYNRQKSPELYEFFTPSEKKEPVKPVLWENPFGDVNPGDWFYEDVKYVTQKALFEGTSDTTFSPDDTMTYGMVLTVLGRMAKIDTADYGGDGAKYYEPYVNWARAKDLLGDIADFDPTKDITREDLAVLLYNYAKLMGLNLPEINDTIIFNDESEISEYAVEAVAAMQKAGIINGRTDGNFDPTSTATRAEVAAMFHRFCETIK